MEIIAYKVVRSTGKIENLQSVETVFPVSGGSDLPIVERRKAIKFATGLYLTLKEGKEDGYSPYVGEYTSDDKDKNIFWVTVDVVIKDDDDEYQLTIWGELLQVMLENWQEELACYLENGYDTGGALYIVNVSIFHLGNVTVLKDVYDESHQLLSELREKKEKEED